MAGRLSTSQSNASPCQCTQMTEHQQDFHNSTSRQRASPRTSQPQWLSHRPSKLCMIQPLVWSVAQEVPQHRAHFRHETPSALPPHGSEWHHVPKAAWCDGAYRYRHRRGASSPHIHLYPHQGSVSDPAHRTSEADCRPRCLQSFPSLRCSLRLPPRGRVVSMGLTLVTCPPHNAERFLRYTTRQRRHPQPNRCRSICAKVPRTHLEDTQNTSLEPNPYNLPYHAVSEGVMCALCHDTPLSLMRSPPEHLAYKPMGATRWNWSSSRATPS